MTAVCAKCRTMQKLDVIADAGVMSFCVCSDCGGTALYRRQVARGSVARGPHISSVVEISGEIDA